MPTTPSRLLLSLVLLGGAVGGLGALLLAPTPAWAQSGTVFEAQGLIEVVPPTGLVGDGANVADIYLVALGADGRPIAGLKGRPTATAGTPGELTEVGGGLYKFTWLPPKLAQRTAVTFNLKVKLPSKENVSRTWTFNVEAPARHQVAVAANPPQLTLNQDRNASLSITLSGGDAGALAGADLRANVSSGTVDNLTNLGNGQYSALYTLPTVGYPHVALITVADRKDPTNSYGAIAVPLVGKADFPVTVAPNAKVMLKVAGREFGPIQADAQGRAKVPIIVPPGASNASRVQIAADGKVTEEPIDLKIPESRRLALIPASAAIPSDARMQVPVRVFVVTPEGRPDENAQVVVTASAGVMGPARHEGGGVYVAMYSPPTGNANTQATFSASLANGSSTQTDGMTVSLVPARPTKVSLSAEPAVLAPSAEGFKVFAKVVGPDGAGLGARTLTFTANGAKLKEVKDLRNGDYQATFTTTGNGPAEVSAVVANAATGNPLHRVLLLPARDRMPADGLSSTALTVATVDEYGYPVPNVPVNLRLASGDGSLPAMATTGPDGIAQIYYTAGRKNGLVTAEATVGNHSAMAALYQAPLGFVGPTLPFSGQRPATAVATEWAGSLGQLRLEREGMTGALVTPAAPVAVGAARPGSGSPDAVVAAAAAANSVAASAVSGVAGKAARMGLVAEPASVAPGSTTTLKITLTDDSGRGVAGQSLEFLTSTGSVGPVTDLGGGAYTAALSVPGTTTGEVKVSVATPDGTVSSFVRLPVASQVMWSNTATTPFGTAAATSTPTASTQPASTPGPVAAMGTTDSTATTTSTATVVRTDDGDRPWLRARAGLVVSGYAYTSMPLDQSGAVYPTELEVGSLAPGGAALVRAWIPGFRWAGVEASFKTTTYAINPEPLCAEIGRPCTGSPAIADYVSAGRVLALGRYAFDAGNTQIWIGGRVGYSAADVQAIQVAGDELKFPQLVVSSLALGAEVGAEIGERLFVSTALTEDLAGGGTPWSTQFGVDLGYAFTQNVFAAVGYDLTVRRISVLDEGNEKVGQLEDLANAALLSIGFQL